MAYEIFSREVVRDKEPVITLSKRGIIVFNVAATKVLNDAGVTSAFLMWDSEAKKFAIRPTVKKDTRAFKIRYSPKSKWAAISAKGFLKHIGHDKDKTIPYAATWHQEQMMFEVPVNVPQPQEQGSLAANRQSEPERQKVSTNGHTTRKEAVANFLRQHGPATKGEIVSSLRIPTGTVAYVLNNPETFVSREGKWHLVA